MIIWRPATTYYIIGGLVLFLIGIVVFYILSNFQPTTLVRVESGGYNLRIADTEPERALGLSGVTSLASDGGLLMKYDTDGKWAIWMKDMEIPIDIVWLDKGKKVIHIVEKADPTLATSVVYRPETDARYIIEIAAGGVDKAGIKTGSVAEFDENDTGELWK